MNPKAAAMKARADEKLASSRAVVRTPAELEQREKDRLHLKAKFESALKPLPFHKR